MGLESRTEVAVSGARKCRAGSLPKFRFVALATCRSRRYHRTAAGLLYVHRSLVAGPLARWGLVGLVLSDATDKCCQDLDRTAYTRSPSPASSIRQLGFPLVSENHPLSHHLLDSTLHIHSSLLSNPPNAPATSCTSCSPRRQQAGRFSFPGESEIGNLPGAGRRRARPFFTQPGRPVSQLPPHPLLHNTT